MKIRVLSEETINKIAAGEVVERPASVVKELVENSIDAGATEVSVEVKTGGKNLIRVSDNGSGMDKDDALLAFSRHATSKISTEEDLMGINTLGFRGEALPSIAAVSKLELVTRTKEMAAGVRIRIEGGKTIEVKETGAPCGTMVCVQNLFYNTPARRKFLKSNTTELSHIISTISNYCLIYTNCGFRLNGTIEIFPKDSLLDRIRILYGNETAESLASVDFAKDGIIVRGFAGRPSATYPNRSHQFVFVNKRPITSRTVSYAVYDAYSTLIPRGRFPAVFLEISCESIDVNVHPAKKEVRFGDDRLVQEAVREGILDALSVKRAAVPAAVEDAKPDFSYVPPYSPQGSWDILERHDDHKVIQMNNSYIVTETDDGFEIMDQHAVHERVLYERIKTRAPEGQRLLIPINIELTPAEENMFKKQGVLLKELGFNIEEFGGRSVIIDMIPAVMDKADIALFIKDVLHEKAVSHEDVKDGIIETMACRAAVKQGDKLDVLEMQRLVRDWRQAKLPYTCPHGRPAVVKMTRQELDRKFQRT